MTIFTYNQYKKINSILTEAFKNNKSVNYVLSKNTPNYISMLMDYSLYSGKKFGKIFLNKEETACAIMIDPKKKKKSIAQLFRDFKFIIQVVGFSKLKRVLVKEKVIENVLPKDLDFIHLWFLGTEQKEQGKGIGTKLLLEIIEYYKGKKQAICLETSTEINLPFYKKNGFEIYEEKDFGFKLYFFIYKY